MNIVITGVSRGVGYELVKLFVGNNGNKIIGISRNRDKLGKLENECKIADTTSEFLPLVYDIQKDDYSEGFYPRVKIFLGSVDVIINNAGYLVNKPFIELSDEDFDDVFSVNVKGPFRVIQTLKPLMAQDSHVVNIGSMGGVQGSLKFPGLSVYSASKGALAILTECLAEEFKNDNIKVNCLALGSVNTEMLAEAFPGYKAPVTAKEMARFVADFAENGHKHFNGKVLPVSSTVP